MYRKKPADKPHPKISYTLNLAAQILEKKVFWKKSKEIQSRALRSLLHLQFIERKLTINGKYFKVLPTILALLYNEHRFYQLWHMIDLFLVFIDRNFFIQHSFSIDFCITTRTWAEDSKLSNQALDRTRVKTFTAPFSNVPAEKPHPQFQATIFGKKVRLICGFLCNWLCILT